MYLPAFLPHCPMSYLPFCRSRSACPAETPLPFIWVTRSAVQCDLRPACRLLLQAPYSGKTCRSTALRLALKKSGLFFTIAKKMKHPFRVLLHIAYILYQETSSSSSLRRFQKIKNMTIPSITRIPRLHNATAVHERDARNPGNPSAPVPDICLYTMA